MRWSQHQADLGLPMYPVVTTVNRGLEVAEDRYQKMLSCHHHRREISVTSDSVRQKQDTYKSEALVRRHLSNPSNDAFAPARPRVSSAEYEVSHLGHHKSPVGMKRNQTLAPYIDGRNLTNHNLQNPPWGPTAVGTEVDASKDLNIYNRTTGERRRTFMVNDDNVEDIRFGDLDDYDEIVDEFRWNKQLEELLNLATPRHEGDSPLLSVKNTFLNLAPPAAIQLIDVRSRTESADAVLVGAFDARKKFLAGGLLDDEFTLHENRIYPGLLDSLRRTGEAVSASSFVRSLPPDGTPSCAVVDPMKIITNERSPTFEALRKELQCCFPEVVPLHPLKRFFDAEHSRDDSLQVNNQIWMTDAPPLTSSALQAACTPHSSAKEQGTCVISLPTGMATHINCLGGVDGAVPNTPIALRATEHSSPIHSFSQHLSNDRAVKQSTSKNGNRYRTTCCGHNSYPSNLEGSTTTHSRRGSQYLCDRRPRSPTTIDDWADAKTGAFDCKRRESSYRQKIVQRPSQSHKDGREQRYGERRPGERRLPATDRPHDNPARGGKRRGGALHPGYRQSPEPKSADRPPKNPDGNTTIMLRNIPNKYTQKMLLDVIDTFNFKSKYDFYYLPIDFHNQCNVGYAFINFTEPRYAEEFWKTFDGYKLGAFKSKKVCEVSWGRVQGMAANIEHYRNSAIMSVPYGDYKPLIFRDGSSIPFPDADGPLPTVKLRPPRR